MTYRLLDVDPNHPADAQRLADLFNAFDSAWPGGFSRGATETAESIRAYLGRARRVAICAVEHEGELVGYCDLLPFPGDPDRVYVDLLGARVEHHGRGVGKMLLLEMVRRACELDCRQLTLHTWAGNTKAVPLYKRTGFQWEPDTEVHMRNFMPTILAMPAGRAFFASADWYACQERDLALVPDDRKWHGMPAYEYRFRNGDDFLNVWIDRASERVAAVETARYLVGCAIPVEEAAAGETCPIEWTIQSHGQPLEVAIAAQPSDGLTIDLHERFTLDGETTLRRDLRLAPDAHPDRRGDPPHAVRTNVLIDGEPIELETGVKVTRPIDIAVSGCGLRLGRTEQLRVQLHSRVDRDLRGRISLTGDPELVCDAPVAPFELPARSWTEHRFPLTASAAGVHVAAIRVEAGDVRASRDVPIRAYAGSEVLAVVDDYDELAVIESAALRVEADLRGGRVRVFAATTGRHLASVPAPEVGPPFSGYRVRPDMYRARFEAPQGVPTLILSRDSTEIEGLVVERRVSLDGGDALRLVHRFANSTDEPRSVSMRLGVWSDLQGQVTYPLAQGLVREPWHGWGYYPGGVHDVLPVGGRLAESWSACDNDGTVVGAVWDRADEEQVGWGSQLPALTYGLGEVPAHGAAETPPVWLVAGPGSWEAVRGWWRRTVQPAGEWEESSPVPRRVFEVGTDPSPAILRPGDSTIHVTASNLRGNTAAGALDLAVSTSRPPTEAPVLDPASLQLPDIDRDHPFAADVAVRVPEGPFAAIIGATARLSGHERRFDLPVIRLAAAGDVTVQDADGIVIVDNGPLRYRVAPGFGGSVTSLEWAGAERLRSGYPTVGPFVWAGLWFGGIHPAMDWIGGSYLAREAFTGGPTERLARDGTLWRGVRVSCEPAHRDRRWLKIEADYLTAPGSNVLLILLRWTNRTSAEMQPDHEPCLAVWLAPGGDAGTEAHWVRFGRHEVQRIGEFSRDIRSDSWAAVADPATGTATVLVPGGRQAKAYVEDFAANGQHLGMWMPMTLRPGETREAVAWLVLCRSAEIEAYAALRDAWA